jgi:hypothetical protein
VGDETLSLPEAIELDPNLVISREDLMAWATEASDGIDASPLRHGSETFAALDQVVVCGRREYHFETACMAALWSELHARGLASYALRVLIQVAVDNGIETLARRAETPPCPGEAQEGAPVIHADRPEQSAR